MSESDGQDDIITNQTPTQNISGSSKQQMNEELVDLDNVLMNQDQEQLKRYDPAKYPGYDGLVRYFSDNGSNKAQVHVWLSHLDNFKVPYNISGDWKIGKFQLMDLRYHPITTKANDQRQLLLAEVDDLTRQQQVHSIKLREMDQAIQQRAADRFISSQAMHETKSYKSLDHMTVQEIQSEIDSLQAIDLNISKKIQEKRIEADVLGFQIYFHMTDREVYDNCRNDQLTDILKGCDQKQLKSIATNSKNSLSSLTQGRQGVT